MRREGVVEDGELVEGRSRALVALGYRHRRYDRLSTQDRFIARDIWRFQPSPAEGEHVSRTWDWQEVRRLCLREARRLLSEAEAEDAVQEALIRAWRHRACCRDPSAPLPWLLQITRNEARRIRTRSHRRGEVWLDEGRAGDPVEDRTEHAAERAALQAALGALAIEDRTLLQMRYSNDLTQSRVAEVLGLPEGTVKVRLHRLRRRLRGALESDQ